MQVYPSIFPVQTAEEILSCIGRVPVPINERNSLERVCRRATDYFDPDGATTAGAEIAQFLADRLFEYAPTLYEELDRARKGFVDAVYFSGLPTDPDIARLVTLVLTYRLGMAFNYSTQNSGALVMMLRPELSSAANTNAAVGEIEWHSDDAAVPREFRASWIQLYGIVNPRKTLTGYAPVKPVLNYLPGWAVSVLSEHRYRVRVPLSFNVGDDIWSGARPILSVSETEPPEIAWPSCATQLVHPDDDEALGALTELRKAVEKFALNVPVNPGSFFAFNNLRGVHMRSKIENGERLVFRTYARENLQDLRVRTGSFGPIFDTQAVLAACRE